MKKAFLILALVGSGAATAQAQSSALKLNLFSLAVNTGAVSFEQKTGDMTSFQLGAFYTGYSIGGTKLSGFGITPEYRFYVTGEALQGFYLAPYLRYQNFNLTDDTNYGGSSTKNEASYSTFGGGVNLGYQWVFKQHIVLEPLLRVGYNKGSVNVKSGGDNYDLGSFNGFSVLPGLNLGYAF